MSSALGVLHWFRRLQIGGALFLALAFWLSAGASAADLHGKVVGVADGDTVTVLDAEKHQHKIRLASLTSQRCARLF